MPPRAEMGIKPNAYPYNMKTLYFGSLKRAFQRNLYYVGDITAETEDLPLIHKHLNNKESPNKTKKFTIFR